MAYVHYILAISDSDLLVIGLEAIQEEAIASRWEAIASRWEATASRFEAIASRLEAIARRLEAIASRLEAIAGRLEAIARRLEAIDSRLEAIASRLEAITSKLETIRFEAINTPTECASLRFNPDAISNLLSKLTLDTVRVRRSIPHKPKIIASN